NVTASNYVVKNPTKGHFLLTMTAQTPNTMRFMSTMIGNQAVTHWQPGEAIGVNLNDTLTILQMGTVSITQHHSSGKTLGPTQTLSTMGSGVFSVTAASTPLGSWTLNATFTSPYDYGTNSTSIQIEHLKLGPGFTYSGDNSIITATGVIQSESTTISPSPNTPLAIFGVSTATSGNYSKSFPAATSGLYIANITFVNGIFSSGKPLIIYLAIVNPTNTTMVGNLTMTHLFLPASMNGQPHGVNATFSLDRPLETPLPPGTRFYEIDVAFSNARMNLRITSLRTNAPISATSGTGTPPLYDSRQQFGVFNFTITSQKQTGGGPITSTSVESQPFAYVFANSLLARGGRVLMAKIGQTDGSGAFTLSADSSATPAGRQLSFIVLARDPNGITLGNQDPTATTDNVVFQPSVQGPTEAIPSQSVTLTLTLRNNSTKLGMNLNVTLQVFSGSNPAVPSITKQTGLITAGASKEIQFQFNAPSALGAYSLIFSSVQYGAPILTATFNVVLVPTWLAIALPAVIGVVVAVALSLFYRRRRPATTAAGPTPIAKAKPAGPKTGPRNP
ncbi:MAG TPA: hypothetical protein VE177_06075, partial [Candidatus Binatus sp.]|nr:hypothetical protein [Candidatus Binatus sp.]